MVKVDESKCIGCGVCAALCPEVFELNEEGKSTVKAQSCDKHDLKEVADTCASGAISVEEVVLVKKK